MAACQYTEILYLNQALLSYLHPCAWHDILKGAKGPFVVGWSLHFAAFGVPAPGAEFFYISYGELSIGASPDFFFPHME